MFIIRFNFFKNDFGYPGNPKVRTELLCIRLSWVPHLISTTVLISSVNFNLALKKEVKESFLFWLNWYQQADSESITLRIFKGTLLLPELMRGKNMAIF